MARTLESLTAGTPVFAGETRVGDVRGVYAEGDARSAELVVVHWDALRVDVGVPATEIEDIDDEGVSLVRTEADQYKDFTPFDPSRYPTLRKIA
ncbi:MAG: hypothetical protein ABR975_13105 [Vulcanimicrobiaceae bacterium]|jgi:hypothetical protein